MVAYAEEVAATEQAQEVGHSPQPATAAHGSAESDSWVSRPDNPGPSQEESFHDFLDHDRRLYDNFQDDLQFNRIRDDAVDYTAPSYDSYDSYSPDNY